MIYDRLGRWYDVLTAGEGRLRRAGLALLYPQPGELALEIGCGTGHALASLARHVGGPGKVIGLDLSPAMLDVARRRLRRERLLGRAVLVRGDARRLPVASKSVDLAFVSFTLELFDDADCRLVLAECRRVLRENGRLGVVALDALGEHSPMCSIYDWMHRKWPETIDCSPIPVHRLVESAGYEVVASADKAYWGLAVAVIVARPRAVVTSTAD